MQHTGPSTCVDARRRCSGMCSTSYLASRCSRTQAARPWRAVAKASTSSIFDVMDRQFADMERQFGAMQRQMDRDIDMALSRAREAERQADAEFQRAMTGTSATTRQSTFFQEMRPAPNVDIQRQEEVSPGAYRYYERIQITGTGGGSVRGYVAQPPPVPKAAVAPVSPALNPVFIGALVVLGGYVTMTAAFSRNYALTNYAESKRWLLLALWPLLFLFSAKFREQFAAAIRGERVPLKREGQAASGEQ
ncbi:hypothetical protein Vretimale_9207 [Volvox reticuliferus]|uniref:Uncharacterized protein n=1 Tax=Volvox reticuliferus TaxID=1737510 RepID=A0A8J4GCC8_9CHLO|nr:hypothetical protein Vretifemale_9977 [Volvox reticuliferus]GIM04702.1 hypothetical protein Vretimale_9207 [Volvox reticuliferus]